MQIHGFFKPDVVVFLFFYFPFLRGDGIFCLYRLYTRTNRGHIETAVDTAQHLNIVLDHVFLVFSNVSVVFVNVIFACNLLLSKGKRGQTFFSPARAVDGLSGAGRFLCK